MATSTVIQEKCHSIHKPSPRLPLPYMEIPSAVFMNFIYEQLSDSIAASEEIDKLILPWIRILDRAMIDCLGLRRGWKLGMEPETDLDMDIERHP